MQPRQLAAGRDLLALLRQGSIRTGGRGGQDFWERPQSRQFGGFRRSLPVAWPLPAVPLVVMAGDWCDESYFGGVAVRAGGNDQTGMKL